MTSLQWRRQDGAIAGYFGPMGLRRRRSVLPLRRRRPWPGNLLQRRCDSLAVLVGNEVQRIADQVNDAGLDLGLWKHRGDRLRKALQAIDDGDQDVFDAAVLQLVHDAQPEFRALGLLDPQAENFLGSVGQLRAT